MPVTAGIYLFQPIYLYGRDKMKYLKIFFLFSLFTAICCQANDAQADRHISIRTDVPYLDDGHLLHCLDIYSPGQTTNPLTTLFHIHGGGWKMGDKKLMEKTGRFYASRNVLFITPNYRLTPEVMHPGHIEDCAAALAWVFAHTKKLEADPSRIFISGHSAGAHLAALLGTDHQYLQKNHILPDSIAGVICIDTASFNLLAASNGIFVKKLINNAFGSTIPVLEGASPFYQVQNKHFYPGFLILNTTDRKNAARQGRLFAEKLTAAGSSARFVPVDNHTHSEMAQGMYDISDPVAKAILQFLFQATDIK